MPLSIRTVKKQDRIYEAVFGEQDDFIFPKNLIVLGEGKFALVQLCKSRGTLFAGKLYRSLEEKDQIELSKRECTYARQLVEHPNILKFVSSLQFIDEDSYDIRYITVYELMAGGNLDELMLSVRLSEAQNRRLIEQLLNGLEFMHSQKFMHRDLKPESILLSDEDPDRAILKIGGLSTVIIDDEKFEVQCDLTFLSEAFVSPELIFLKKCDRATDMWSAGALIYFMTTNTHPYCELNHTSETKARLRRAIYKRIEYVTEECRNLVNRMLKTLKNQRITAAEALNHPWFSVDIDRLYPAIANSTENPDPSSPQHQQDQQAGLEATDKNDLRAGELKKYLHNYHIKFSSGLTLRTNNRRTFEQLYGSINEYKFQNIFQVIGHSSKFSVQKCVSTSGSKKYAARIAECSNSQAFVALIMEVDALQAIGKHKHIVELNDSFIAYAQRFNEDGESLGKILIGLNIYEYCGKNLTQLCRSGQLTEVRARDLIKNILTGLSHIHSKGYLHGDLKSKNILVDAEGVAKICDFTTAVKMDNEFTLTFNATPQIQYTSPEFAFVHVCRMSHDIWSVGVILYEMIELDLPFIRYHANDMSVSSEELENFKNGIYDEMTCVTQECKDLLKQFFTLSASQRISADEALNHSWFSLNNDLLFKKNEVPSKIAKRKVNLKLFEAARKVNLANYMVKERNLLVEREDVTQLLKDLAQDDDNTEHVQDNNKNNAFELLGKILDLSQSKAEAQPDERVIERKTPKPSTPLIVNKTPAKNARDEALNQSKSSQSQAKSNENRRKKEVKREPSIVIDKILARNAQDEYLNRSTKLNEKRGQVTPRSDTASVIDGSGSAEDATLNHRRSIQTGNGKIVQNQVRCMKRSYQEMSRSPICEFKFCLKFDLKRPKL